MNQQDFKLILSNINNICNDVKQMRRDIETINVFNLGEYVIKDNNSKLYFDTSEQLAKASEYQSKIDKILKSEFYHLVGMGNLSSSQTISLCKRIKELGETEDINKRNVTILNNLKSIQSTMLNKSSYKLKELSNITLN